MRVSLGLPATVDSGVVLHRAGERPLVDPRLHQHDELEFNLAIAGRGRVLCAGRWYDLRPGLALWLFPGQAHMLMEQDRDFAMWVAVWRPQLVRRQARLLDASTLADSNPADQHHRRLSPAAARRLGDLCSSLAGETHLHRRRLGMTWLLADAWRQGSVAEATAQLPPPVERAMRLLQEDDSRLTLPALAKACGVSPSWLSRSFARHVGMPMQAFRTRMRLARVIEGWKPGDNLLHAALDAGFGSYNRFHAAFRRWVGSSPRAWAAAGGGTRL